MCVNATCSECLLYRQHRCEHRCHRAHMQICSPEPAISCQACPGPTALHSSLQVRSCATIWQLVPVRCVDMPCINKHTAASVLRAVSATCSIKIRIHQRAAACALMDSKSGILGVTLLESCKACIHQRTTAHTLRGVRAQTRSAQVFIGYCRGQLQLLILPHIADDAPQC